MPRSYYDFGIGSRVVKIWLRETKACHWIPRLLCRRPYLKKLNEKKGQKCRFEWLYENINTEQDDYEFENKFANMLLEIEDIPEHVPIYIWTAENANEQIGVRFILHILKEKANEIILLNSTEQDEEYPITHTSQKDPDQLRRIFENNKTGNPLSNEDKLKFQREWQELSQSKEVLRLWINNEITAVPEQYYDELIINTLAKLHGNQENKDFIKTARVIGETLSQMGEMISDSFLEYRIRHLVYTGVFELKGIPKSMRNYSVKIRV